MPDDDEHIDDIELSFRCEPGGVQRDPIMLLSTTIGLYGVSELDYTLQFGCLTLSASQWSYFKSWSPASQFLQIDSASVASDASPEASHSSRAVTP